MRTKKRLNLLSIFLALCAIVLCLPNNIIIVSAEHPQESYPSGEESLCVETEESETEIAISDLIQIPQNDGGTAEIQVGDDFSYHYYPPESGGAYIIQDGVYAFENVGNDGLWMDIQQNQYLPGYHMQQYATDSNPVQTFTNSCLFKITRRAETNSYIIRSMLNNRLTFYFSGNEVLTKEIPPNDNDVDNNDTFELVYSSYYKCIMIKPYSSSNVVAANNTTASGMAGAPNSYLIKSTQSASGNQSRWYMYQYTGETKSNVFFSKSPSTTNGMDIGTPVSFKTITWTTEIGKNTPYAMLHPDYVDMASATWDASTYTLTVMPIKAGPINLRGIIRSDGTTTAFRTVLFTYVATPNINAKVGFIKNSATGKYMDIEGPSRAEGAFIQQWQFNDKTQSKWLFEAQSGGYFTIKSQYSNMYVGVDPTNTEYIRQYNAIGNNTLWKFIETSSGNYKLICKSLEESGYVLATQSQTSGNGSNLVMTPYIDDDNYRDEWNPQQHVVFDNIDLGLGMKSLPDISNLSASNIAAVTDFTYSIVGSTVPNAVSINSTTREITAKNIGVALIKATSNTFGTHFFKVNVKNLLIYRTRNRERLGFLDPDDINDVSPIIAEDLIYGQKSTDEITSNGTLISLSDLFVDNEPMQIPQRVTIIKNFFNSQISYDPTFSDILSQMVDHFVSGSGEDYCNESLTEAVKNHANTQSYVDAVVNVVKGQISSCNGDIGNLYYDEELWVQPNQRKTHIIVAAMLNELENQNNNLHLPYYGFNNGVAGLTLAIDGWYGNKIEIESFSSHNGYYSGTLRFTFYDHFGLDTSDLSQNKYAGFQAGQMPGFRQWYILQHWSDLGAEVQPKPFVTVVSYTVPFSGTYS